MDNTISIELAKQIMGCNFIGPNELKSINLPLPRNETTPVIRIFRINSSTASPVI